MKRTHMVRTHFSRRDAEVVRLSLCKIHNKTWAWLGSTHWGPVDCERCLAKRKPRAEGGRKK